LLLGLLVGVLAWIPLPGKVVLTPGPALETSSQVQVQGFQRPQDPGHFFITTLFQRPATAWWALRSWVQPDWSLVPAGDGPPLSQPAQAMELDNHDLLREVVYQTCGLEASQHLVVLDVIESSPLFGIAERGSELLSLNGVQLTQVRQVTQLLARSHRRVQIELQKPDGTKIKTEVEPQIFPELSGRRGLGLRLSHRVDVRHLPTIQFRSGAYQGNSSDLMLALDICEQLLGLNLRQGRRLAGSGGLARDGSLTRVQGLPQKLTSARRVRAEVFFVPKEDLSQLGPRLPRDIQVVGLNSLGEAISWLRQHGR
jgi:PDZ domain-containing protein